MSAARVCVVTGASRGLGYATARSLARLGHVVIATARNVADLRPLCDEVEAGGREVTCLQLDVTDSESAAMLAARIRESYGRVDTLINNAGIAVERFDGSVLDMSVKALQETLDTNLIGALRVTQALAPLLRASRAGRIVNLSSGLGQLSDMGTGAPAYRISKSALNALTRLLAKEMIEDGIKVNAVCPGWCRTDMGGDSAPRSPDQGIDTVIWLAMLPDDGPTDGFFRDRQKIPW